MGRKRPQRPPGLLISSGNSSVGESCAALVEDGTEIVPRLQVSPDDLGGHALSASIRPGGGTRLHQAEALSVLVDVFNEVPEGGRRRRWTASR